MMKLYKKAGNLNQIKAYTTCSVCTDYIDKCYMYCKPEMGEWTRDYQYDWYRTWLSFDNRGGK